MIHKLLFAWALLAIEVQGRRAHKLFAEGQQLELDRQNIAEKLNPKQAITARTVAAHGKANSVAVGARTLPTGLIHGPPPPVGQGMGFERVVDRRIKQPVKMLNRAYDFESTRDKDASSKMSWQRPKRHPVFESTNAEVFRSPPPKRIWNRIIPDADVRGVLSALSFNIAERVGSIGKDITVEFIDPEQGALELMSRCGFCGPDFFNVSDPQVKLAIGHLTSLFAYYQAIVSYVHQQESDRLGPKCRARLVSSRGSVGQKCPRWHTDKVPVRLISSLVGPGTDFIPTEMEFRAGLNRDAVESLQEPDTCVANAIIVSGSTTEGEGFVSAREGDAVILMGKSWQRDDERELVKAAVHRSPELGPLEGRVLLSVTVAPDVV